MSLSLATSPCLRACAARVTVVRLFTDVREGSRSQVHFKHTPNRHPVIKKEVWDNPIPHEVWSKGDVLGVRIEHKPVLSFRDSLAYAAVQVMRTFFDKLSGYSKTKPVEEDKFLQRMIFLETVAGVPGMVAGVLRHLQSLRRMERDHGWIHTLLEEAENERMHLLTFLKLKDPSLGFRAAVLITQGIFWNAYFVTYLVSPTTCHRFVGYLEEEAVKTYTHAIEEVEAGRLPKWTNMPAPPIAIGYWKLAEDAKFLDVLYAIRADEANHRDVNHSFADIPPNATNPNLRK